MLITVRQITEDNNATLSEVDVDGHFECFGLEDECREFKIPSQTRIPRGKYRIGLRKEGGFHARYSSKFPSFHRGMLEVLDVPNFDYVLIHIGNTDADTAGCLLVGAIANTVNGLTLSSSTLAYKLLYQHVIDAVEADELWIEYL